MRFWNDPFKYSYKGLVRFDLVPKFNSTLKIVKKGGITIYDLGKLDIAKIYELNDRSPECGVGVSALHSAREDLAGFQPSAACRFAQKLKKKFGENITLIRGKGFLKDNWGDIFFEDLKRCGINLEVISPEEFIIDSKNKTIYLFGDYRKEGPAEFTEQFMEYIKNYPREKIFNSLPNEHGYISDKRLLFPKGIFYWDNLVGDNRVLNSKAIKFGLEKQNNLVLKPFLGSSGGDIFMGRLFSSQEWKEILESYCYLGEGKYGLFEACWLPKLKLPPFGEYAIDINPTFWAEGDCLEYLYTISRIDEWNRYWKQGVINVAKGGGFIGTLIDYLNNALKNVLNLL